MDLDQLFDHSVPGTAPPGPISDPGRSPGSHPHGSGPGRHRHSGTGPECQLAGRYGPPISMSKAAKVKRKCCR